MVYKLGRIGEKIFVLNSMAAFVKMFSYLHKKELHNLYAPPHFIRVIKSGRTR